MTTQDLVPWLRECVAEDRAAALAARAEWGDEDGNRDSDWEEWRLSGMLEDAGWYPVPQGLDRHWQLHSPRAVLARCEAHEAILDLHFERSCGRGVCNECNDPVPCGTARALALAYRHRDGYIEEEWRL